MKSIVILILLIISISITGLVFFFTTAGGLLGDCDINEISRTVSPNSEYEARVFKRDCGATTLIATVVAIRETEHTTEFQDIFVVEGDLQITANWFNTTELLVSSGSIDQESVYKNISRWKSVRITYELNTIEHNRGHPSNIGRKTKISGYENSL